METGGLTSDVDNRVRCGAARSLREVCANNVEAYRSRPTAPEHVIKGGRKLCLVDKAYRMLAISTGAGVQKCYHLAWSNVQLSRTEMEGAEYDRVDPNTVPS